MRFFLLSGLAGSVGADGGGWIVVHLMATAVCGGGFGVNEYSTHVSP
jgi:hypothetical protein